jgi:hypothetical protein
VLSVYL